jgi:hypothetical protein
MAVPLRQGDSFMRRFIVAAALAVVASSAFAGVTYHYSSTTEGMAHTMLDGNVAIEGSRLRIDMAHGDGMLFKDGAIVLSTDGGKTLHVLDPSSKTYYDLELSQLLGAGNSALSQLGADLKIENPKVNVVDQGDGGTIEGFATKRSRIDSSYDRHRRRRRHDRIAVRHPAQSLPAQAGRHREDQRDGPGDDDHHDVLRDRREDRRRSGRAVRDAGRLHERREPARPHAVEHEDRGREEVRRGVRASPRPCHPSLRSG